MQPHIILIMEGCRGGRTYACNSATPHVHICRHDHQQPWSSLMLGDSTVPSHLPTLSEKCNWKALKSQWRNVTADKNYVTHNHPSRFILNAYANHLCCWDEDKGYNLLNLKWCIVHLSIYLTNWNRPWNCREIWHFLENNPWNLRFFAVNLVGPYLLCILIHII